MFVKYQLPIQDMGHIGRGINFNTSWETKKSPDSWNITRSFLVKKVRNYIYKFLQILQSLFGGL